MQLRTSVSRQVLIASLATMAAASFSACGVDTTVPSDTRIHCSSAAECPDGYDCRALGFCVANGAEVTPPALIVDASPLAPNPASAGLTITATFSVTEPLARDPIVTLKAGYERSFTRKPDVEPFVYTATVEATAGDGSWPVIVDLVDLSGNAANGLGLGSLVLDFTAPTLAGPVTASQRVLAPDDPTELTLHASEALSQVPIVHVVTADGSEAIASPISEDPDTHGYVVGYSATGLEAEGAASLAIELRDVAGNGAVVTASDVLRFDHTGPSVVPHSGSLQLIPAPQNIFSDVSTAKTGTVIRVAFLLDEEVADGTTPEVKASGIDTTTSQESQLDFNAEIVAGRTFVYTHTVAGDDVAQATYTLQVTAQDAVGNVATSALELPAPDLTIDTHAPSPPDVETVGRVFYRRIPWGAITSDAAPSFTLEAAAGAIEGGAWLVAYDGSDLQTAARIGLAPAKADDPGKGSVPAFPLNRMDRSRIWVTAVDTAGNESAPVMVRSVEWTASMGQKRPLSYIENPHEMAAISDLMLGTATQPFATVGGSLAGTETLDGTSVTTTGALFWKRADSAIAVPSGGGFAMTWAGDIFGYDVVLFGGGTTAGTLSGVTYHFNTGGADWTAGAETGPIARSYHAMAFDEKNGRVLLFGGWDPTAACAGASNGCCRDTWSWYGNAWTQVSTAGPSARCGHTMAYDTERQQVVLFGGRTKYDCGTTACEVNDTWAWNGTAWASVTTTSPPSARSGHAMAYDSTRRRLVVFGGRVDVGAAAGTCPDGSAADSNGICLLKDVYELNNTTWTQAAGSPPTARFGAAMVYDPSRRNLLMWGGQAVTACDGPGANACRQFHTFDGTLWRTPAIATEASPFATAGSGVALEYVPWSRSLVLADESGATYVGDSGSANYPAQLMKTTYDAAGASGQPLVKINFQPPGYPTPQGYLADEGAQYGDRGNGFSYGWSGGSCTDYEVLGDPSSPDSRYDTRNRFYTGFCATWELGLSPGNYRVFAVSDYTKGGMKVEGVVALPAQTSGDPYMEPNVVVPVSDGNLTLTRNGSQDSKISFLHVYPADDIEELKVTWYGSGNGAALFPAVSGQLNVSPTGTTFTTTYDETNFPLSNLVGQSPNRLWRFKLVNNSTTVTATLNQWCVRINGGTQTCRNPALAFGRSIVRDVMNLTDAGLPVVTTAQLSVNITQTAANSLTPYVEIAAAPGAPFSEAKLVVRRPFQWVDLAGVTSCASAFGSSCLTWSTADPDDLNYMFSGLGQVIQIAALPKGPNGCRSEYASVTTDYAEVSVRYELPPQ